VYYFAEEISPHTGRSHRHIYLELARKKSLNVIKRWFTDFFNINPHLEGCIGSRESNLNDFSKESPLQGVKAPVLLPQITQLFSTPLDELLLTNPTFLMNHASSYFQVQKHIVDDYSPIEKIPKKIFWFHGLTGTGKTFTARAQINRLYEEAKLKWWQFPIPNTHWFDGYHNQ
jgi:hypothetical protein